MVFMPRFIPLTKDVLIEYIATIFSSSQFDPEGRLKIGIWIIEIWIRDFTVHIYIYETGLN